VCEPMAQRIRLRTDKVALTRILDNLVSNAIKFTDRGGVSVAAELGPERAISIRVRDSGIGIAPESLASVFDEYARLSDVNRDHAKGWGLGLPICRRLAEALGGEIALESELHRGSVFTVRLPAACLVADA
jgi:signal transduction histidine kinase